MTRTLLPLTLLLAAACNPTGGVKFGDDTGSSTPEECSYYSDADGDGYGDDATEVVTACDEQPAGTVAEGGDCDDLVALVNPGADEVCDGVDNDCSGQADDNAIDATTWYYDNDGDGYGGDDSARVQCVQPSGTTSIGGDCDDDDTAYNPGASEEDCADPNDYNCDGSTGYDDLDGDGFPACEECDDNDANINPDATEICDGVDNDCDALIDDADDSVDASTYNTFYVDADGDNYGDADSPVESCAASEGTVSSSSDCDDSLAQVNPGAVEICDGLDNDCDALIDDADDSVDVSTYTTWYADADGDGYGTGTDTVDACEVPEGYGEGDADCDDANPDLNPGAAEICDGQDQNCDGVADDGFTDTDGDTTADCVDACPVYADPSLTSNGDGSETSPYMSINDAITLRGEYCDEILLLPGTYEEVVDYGGADLSIRSTDGADSTIVDASSVGGSVFTFDSGETDAAILSGVTITGGSGNAGDNSSVTSGYDLDRSDDHGGGVYIQGSDPTITDCIIEGNSVDGFGGGVMAYDYQGTFSGNQVLNNESSYEQFGGGGLWLYDSNASIIGNTFMGNEASGSSGDGGGLHAIQGDPTITHNWFEDNSTSGNSSSYGEGVRLYDVGGLFANNVIVNHDSGQGVTVSDGQAIYFFNNTIDGNWDGLYITDGTGYYYNNNITNSADDGVMWDSSYTCRYYVDFDYNNVWGSGDDNHTNSTCSYYLTRSPYNNESTDPDYTDDGNGDYTLQSGSDVADAGTDVSSAGVTDDYAGTARPQGSAYSIGAFER